MARHEEVDAVEIAHRVWKDLGEGTPPRDLAFQVTGVGLAEADEQGVEQILRNLLDNARRYTPDGGSVTVRVAPDGAGRVSVEVEDTGSGIPSRSLPRIFERFYRADTSRAREVGGTGLGLAIVRHLVQAMGGEVWARSELGRGTTVGFSLPGAGRVVAPPGRRARDGVERGGS
jgi:two-component system phosphate regulon sensor histidine kinase PhoR